MEGTGYQARAPNMNDPRRSSPGRPLPDINRVIATFEVHEDYEAPRTTELSDFDIDIQDTENRGIIDAGTGTILDSEVGPKGVGIANVSDVLVGDGKSISDDMNVIGDPVVESTMPYALNQAEYDNTISFIDDSSVELLGETDYVEVHFSTELVDPADNVAEHINSSTGEINRYTDDIRLMEIDDIAESSISLSVDLSEDVTDSLHDVTSTGLTYSQPEYVHDIGSEDLLSGQLHVINVAPFEIVEDDKDDVIASVDVSIVLGNDAEPVDLSIVQGSHVDQFEGSTVPSAYIDDSHVSAEANDAVMSVDVSELVHDVVFVDMSTAVDDEAVSVDVSAVAPDKAVSVDMSAVAHDKAVSVDVPELADDNVAYVDVTTVVNSPNPGGEVAPLEDVQYGEDVAATVYSMESAETPYHSAEAISSERVLTRIVAEDAIWQPRWAESSSIFLTCVFGLIGLLLFWRWSSRRSLRKKCCCIDFAQGRKTSTIEGVWMADLKTQLAQISRELANMRTVRDSVDAELIETSTQILQSIGHKLASPDCSFYSPPVPESPPTAASVTRP